MAKPKDYGLAKDKKLKKKHVKQDEVETTLFTVVEQTIAVATLEAELAELQELLDQVAEEPEDAVLIALGKEYHPYYILTEDDIDAIEDRIEEIEDILEDD